MPELPEVETVRRGLVPVMEGERIARVEVRRSGLRRPFPARMAERLEGTRVLTLRRRSKYILAELSTGETLIVHLGMSGRILISGSQQGGFLLKQAVPARHDHVILDMENGARIVFNDARRFGSMDLAPAASADRHGPLANLGPEPLGNEFNEEYLSDRFKGRRGPVKAALLDQGIVAGLGNIYVCESLHRAKISPLRPTGRVSAPRIAALIPAIRDVLNEAIEAGGASLRDHRRVDGESGYFQHDFRVYGRAGKSCPANGCAGRITRIVQSGRSTFHCPECQR